MSGLPINITPEGRAALVNADNTGTAPVRVSAIGITASDVGVVGGELVGEIKRLVTFAGSAVADDTVHVTIRDDSGDAYAMRGFALYLDDGTLFGWHVQQAVILEKSAQAMMLLAADIRFVQINATSLSFGDATWTNPPGTETVPGVLELATEDETATGEDRTRAVHPKGLRALLDRRFGAGAPSAFVKGLLGAATAAAVRIALELGTAARRDEGAGNGLDADKLDGQHGAYYLDWNNLTGKPTTFAPAAHGHAWSDITGAPATATRWPAWAEVTGKPSAFTPAAHTHAAADITSGTLALERLPALPITQTTGLQAALDAKAPLSGATFTGPNSNFVGDVGTQTILHVFGWGNKVPRWKWVIEPDGHIALYGYDASGNTPRAATRFRTQEAGGPNGVSSLCQFDQVEAVKAKVIGDLEVGATAATIRMNDSDSSGRMYVHCNDSSIGFLTSGFSWGFRMDNGANCHATGKLSAGGGFDFGSSRKLKDVDGPLPYGLDVVRRVATLIGRYKPQYNSDGRRRLFFDAEQLLELMPEAVDAEGVEFGGERVPAVKLDQVLPPAYRAIAELADLVDELRAEIAALKAVH
ncbi:hypothetical protein [Vulcaniibacterium tengchongense]|uniref:Peptidase S74 domain-containing protein n=1 Tax=Vulcaniibacterium tengchongense TaxID=1273429 RepID=A0A3N4VBW8_9GAMM|nr:hypothetical protein [Vulcaniibacterium tengchongense]RPE74627.1 hypothetical protein EDC50_3156 [Vulcaniibacterium tengchongense]